MTEYSTHTWPKVVAAFHDLGDAVPAFRPLADAVEQLAASPFAPGLHPVKSMHTLQRYQLDRYRPGDEQVRLDFEDGTFVVRHLPQGTPDPRLALRRQPGSGQRTAPMRLRFLREHSITCAGSSNTTGRNLPIEIAMPPLYNER